MNYEALRSPQWAKYALWGLVALITLWETWFMPPVGPLATTITALHFLALLSIPRFPVSGGIATVLVGTACSLFNLQSGPTQVWGIMLALGLLWDRSRPVVAAMAWLITIAAQTVQTMYSPSDELTLPLLATFIGWFTVPCIVGGFLRQRRTIAQTQTAERNMRERLRTAEQDIATAARIHDSISGELAYVLRTAQRQQRLTHDASALAAWKDAEEHLVLARQGLDDVISQLTSSSGDDVDRHGRDSIRVPSEQRLADILRRWDDRLHAQGIDGGCKISGSCGNATDTPTTDIRSTVIADMLEELCVNIEKHLPARTGHYELSVLCSPTAVEITELCTWETPKRSDVRSARSGGLQLHRRTIERIGGNLRIDEQPNQWGCYLTVPLVDTRIND